MRSKGCIAAARSYDPVLCKYVCIHFGNRPALILLTASRRGAADAFVECGAAPQQWAHIGSRLIVLLGASEVTRQRRGHERAAGFTDRNCRRVERTRTGDWNIVTFRRRHSPLYRRGARADQDRDGETTRSLEKF